MDRSRLSFVGWYLLTVPFLIETVDESRYRALSGEDSDDRINESNLDNDNTTDMNCTDSLCLTDEQYQDEYIRILMSFIFPNFFGWVMIVMHGIVFIVGVVGNVLVYAAVYRNHSMRTVTNYFIVNLAVADLLVIVICLPSSVLWDVTETWFFGIVLCKTIPYLQTVSVSVSVLTLTFISIDRWYAICFPLRFQPTTSRMKGYILAIWLFSFVIDIPEIFVLHTVASDKVEVETVLFTQCTFSLSTEHQAILMIIKCILLYVLPLIFMSIAYSQIVRVLWRSDIPGHNLSARSSHSSKVPPTVGGNPEGQLRSRRKAAKMLIAVVFTFAICYLPVHLLSIIRSLMVVSSNKWMVITSLLVHWLCYFNSAVNPLIYNFMSGKFRKEFKRSFRCSRSDNFQTRSAYLAGTTNPHGQRSRTTTRTVQLTMNNNNNNNVQRSTEIIPLCAIPIAEQNEKHE